jgi:hypothetical protein
MTLKQELLRGPAVVPFVECPNCNELLETGATACPRCREEIDPNYAALSTIIVHHNTQACSVANTIIGGNAFIPIAVIGTAVIYIGEMLTLDSPIISWGLIAWPTIPLLSIAFWFVRFGRFRIGDAEYLKARREMCWSFTFWLTLLLVQILLLALAW